MLPSMAGTGLFLSTSPLRGTTHLLLYRLPRPPCISIHVPLAGDDGEVAGDTHTYSISIHVPLAGDDAPKLSSLLRPIIFLSTSPLRGTTVPQGWIPGPRRISIHVPLAGDDAPTLPRVSSAASFLSTSPLRGTTGVMKLVFRSAEFLSTSPLRGTTVVAMDVFRNEIFLSTSPLRGTTYGCAVAVYVADISIHVPLAGDDLIVLECFIKIRKFLSTSPLRGTTIRLTFLNSIIRNFYPRPPCGGRRTPSL